MDEHVVLGPGVVLPARDRLEVHRGELPAPHRVVQAGAEARLLLLVGDAEPVLAQQDPVLDEHPLEDRGLVQEAAVLVGGAEAHDPLDAGAVVPGAVEQGDLAGGRQVRDVALEVPLRQLALGGRRQGDDARDAGVQVLRDPLDRAALAGGVAALEDDHESGAGGADPLLHLDQFGLQAEQLELVERLVHALDLAAGGRLLDVLRLAQVPALLQQVLQLVVGEGLDVLLVRLLAHDAQTSHRGRMRAGLGRLRETSSRRAARSACNRAARSPHRMGDAVTMSP